jgi:hypothetical protein
MEAATRNARPLDDNSQALNPTEIRFVRFARSAFRIACVVVVALRLLGLWVSRNRQRSSTTTYGLWQQTISALIGWAGVDTLVCHLWRDPGQQRDPRTLTQSGHRVAPLARIGDRFSQPPGFDPYTSGTGTGMPMYGQGYGAGRGGVTWADGFNSFNTTGSSFGGTTNVRRY